MNINREINIRDIKTKFKVEKGYQVSVEYKYKPKYSRKLISRIDYLYITNNNSETIKEAKKELLYLVNLRVNQRVIEKRMKRWKKILES